MKPGLLARTLLILGVGTLPACGTLPFALPEMLIPATWSQRPAGSEAAAASLADLAPADLLPAPELAALLEEALRDSSDLRIAIERVELARAQYGLERSNQWPTLALSGSTTRQRLPGANPSENVIGENGSLALSNPAWEIDIWGKLGDRSEAARQQLLASEATAQAVRTSLVAQVATSFLELLDLDNQLAISRRTLDSRRHALRLANARFEEGITSLLDVRQAESLLAGAEVALADQERRVRQTENALSVLIGRPPGPIERRSRLVELPLPREALAGLPSELLLRRPDILAQEHALRSANADVSAARKAFLPSISLTTMLGFVSPQLSQLFTGDRYAWSVQPAVSLPLFTGGRLQSALAASEAQQRILTEQYKATVRQAFREVSDALVAVERTNQQQEASRKVAEANRERLKLSNARYLSGIASYFEVLDAERQLFDSELAHSQASRLAQQSVIQLYRALGGGWQRPDEPTGSRAALSPGA